MSVGAWTQAAAPARASGRAGATFAVEAVFRWEDAAALWRWAAAEGAATAFQDPGWLEAWYGAHAGRPDIAPVLLRATAPASGEVAALLPLVRVRRGGLAILAFADEGLTDYNAPVLGPAAPADAAGAARLWAALRRSLPAADLLHLAKMPLGVEGRPNPLGLLPGCAPCGANGNVLAIGGDWDAYHYGLEKVVRKELERSWRVFQRAPSARFAEIAEPAEALRVLALLEEQQGARMRAAGADYRLDAPEAAAFYRALVAGGLGGHAILTVLATDAELVAALLGIRRGGHYTMVRISNAGGAWSNCSPGRLIIHRTMAHLHGKGVRVFDFSIGNYAYKRRLGVAAVPLVEFVRPLSWRGVPAALKARAVQHLRARPALDARLRRLLGKPVAGEEPDAR